MLKAINVENNQVINLLDEEWKQKRSSLKYFSQKAKLICPQCKKNVRLHWAIPTRKIPHFKHQSNRDCIYGSGESDEHNKGKVILFNYFKTTYASEIKLIDIEHFIPETNQIADIYIQLKDGQRWVVEYQRSNISTEEIRNRKDLYKTNQIKDIWVVGENLIKENGMVTRSIHSSAQELIFTDFTGEASLISFDPITKDVLILRGLLKLNQTTYTIDNEYPYNINDIFFNRWGQPFVVDDYLKVKQLRPAIKRFGTLSLDVHVDSLTHAHPYYIAKTSSNKHGKENKQANMYFTIPPELENFIPLGMQDLVINVDFILDPDEQLTGENPFINDVYPSKWATSIKANNSDPFLEPAKYGNLFNLLVTTYQSHYLTCDEREKELSILLKGKQVSHETKYNYLKKIGVVDTFVSKDSFMKKVSLEEILESFLKMMKVDFEIGTSIEQALRYEIIMPNELESPLTNGILLEIYKRIDSHLHKVLQ
ncbi:competence protein CoiA [Sporosarcina sp. Marseille-Q4943]|uniref:competence protein CoiA n=1 Tax=Sporosarcina sp. Marseille-Q4943 TaxID=2942204 RepID=UPI00208DB8F2|nr:competence protein CoiA family protein [Sporosarcina sp. Marseille-Q4943]